MLNAEYQSLIHKDHKPFIRFLTTEYHKDIFVCWTNELCLLKICILYIIRKKNIVVDRLSQVIFNNLDYSPDWLVSKLPKKVFAYHDNDRWF